LHFRGNKQHLYRIFVVANDIFAAFSW